MWYVHKRRSMRTKKRHHGELLELKELRVDTNPDVKMAAICACRTNTCTCRNGSAEMAVVPSCSSGKLAASGQKTVNGR